MLNKTIIAKRGDNVGPKNSASLSIYEKTKERICQLELKPNAPLIEKDLAEEFGISRTPVREALRYLEDEGLVIHIPGKGAFVAPISFQDLQYIFEVREALEGITCRNAVRRIPQTVLDEWKQRMDAEAKRWEETDRGKPVDELHLLIRKYGANKIIEDIFYRLDGPLERFHNCALAVPQRDRQSFTEHQVIFDKLLLRDEPGAEMSMRRHLQSTKESIIKAWAEDPSHLSRVAVE